MINKLLVILLSVISIGISAAEDKNWTEWESYDISCKKKEIVITRTDGVTNKYNEVNFNMCENSSYEMSDILAGDYIDLRVMLELSYIGVSLKDQRIKLSMSLPNKSKVKMSLYKKLEYNGKYTEYFIEIKD
jgi:hypothetical protein